MKYKINEPVNVVYHGELCDAVIRDIHVKNDHLHIPEIVCTVDVMSVVSDKKACTKPQKQLVEGVEMDERNIVPHPLKKEYGQVMADIKKLTSTESADESKPEPRNKEKLKESIKKDIMNARKHGFMEVSELIKLEEALAKATGTDADIKAVDIIQVATIAGVEQVETGGQVENAA